MIEYLEAKDNKEYLDEVTEAINSIKTKEISKNGLKEIEEKKISASKIKIKYRKLIDDSFTEVSTRYDKLFDVAKIIIDEYNLTPEGFIMCLNDENKQKLKNYADNHFHTNYYKQKEKERFEARKLKRVGIKEQDQEFEDISMFFK